MPLFCPQPHVLRGAAKPTLEGAATHSRKVTLNADYGKLCVSEAMHVAFWFLCRKGALAGVISTSGTLKSDRWSAKKLLAVPRSLAHGRSGLRIECNDGATHRICGCRCNG